MDVEMGWRMYVQRDFDNRHQPEVLDGPTVLDMKNGMHGCDCLEQELMAMKGWIHVSLRVEEAPVGFEGSKRCQLSRRR